jgi:tetratricopeptide (TPR) repeat protein
MKNKNIKYLILFLSLALTTSCVSEDDLVQVNPNEASSESFWKTDADALRGLNAAYSSLLNEGTYMRSSPLLLDLKGDDTRSNSPWGSMKNVGYFNSNVTDPAIYGWAFREYYQGINRSNQVLLNVPNITFTDEALKNRILGQAYFLRGLYLFHLVNMFKNVPIPLDLSVYHQQKSQAEGWAQVMADFTQAAALLPASYNGISGIDTTVEAGNGLGRATKGAALGYLGKAYLFTKDFENAKKTFKKVIDLGVYSLVSNYADNFTDTNENNSESLFEVQFSRVVGGVNLSWGGIPASDWGKTSARAITYGAGGFGFKDVQPTFTLLNEFQEEKTKTGGNDPRLDATIFYLKPGGATPIYQTTFEVQYKDSPADLNDIYCKKYENGGGAFTNEFDWRSGNNERLLRYADILLMYAESMNETGDTQGAYTYIQMVRDRANLPNLSTAKPGLSQDGMREQIGHERFLEFALEGHRFDDIRRWGWLENPVKLAWLKVRDAEFNSFSAGREYFPIPQLEIDTNEFPITQNPSY